MRTVDQIAISAFEACIARGCSLELRVRMLCELVPELHVTAREFSFNGIMIKVVEVLATKRLLTNEEQAFLKKCVTIRNKIAHCELDKAALHAQQLGASLDPGHVFEFRIDTNSSLVDGLQKGMSDTASHVQISSKSSTEVSIGSWLWEAYRSGLFDEAGALFDQANDLINLKALEVAKQTQQV